MKLVIAIIQPTKLNAVREALEKIEVTRLTICDAQGFGRQRGRTELYRGHEYTTTLLRKVALEIMVNDDFLERTVTTIASVARTGPEGTIGDGKIFVLPALEAIQINDGMRRPGVGVTTRSRRRFICAAGSAGRGRRRAAAQRRIAVFLGHRRQALGASLRSASRKTSSISVASTSRRKSR